MRLLADHCVPESIIEAARREGHTVQRVVDLVDPRAPDKDVARLSTRHGAVLLTADADFLRRKDFLPRRYAGIILMRDLHVAKDRVVRRLLRLLAGSDNVRVAGTLVLLDRRSARIRR